MGSKKSKTILLTASMLIGLSLLWGIWHSRTEPSLVGFWMVDASNDHNKTNGPHYWPNPFFFHGDSVTLLIVSMKPWHPEDSYYRLRSKWVDHDLYYLSPEVNSKGVHEWRRLASREGDH